MLHFSDDLSSLTTKDIGLAVVVAIAFALVLKLYVLGAFMIPTSSMESTLLPGDYILVNKLAYSLKSLQHGDVVVFKAPRSVSSTDDMLIKRVVGMSGDTLRLTPDNIFVNGTRMPAPATSLHQGPILRNDSSRTIIVPAGHVFVVGDNRSNSYDSRYWGTLPEQSITGTPLFVYWSVGSERDNSQSHIRWNRIFEMIR